MNVEGYEINETIARSGRTLVRRGRRSRDGAAVVIKSLASEYPTAHELAQLEFEYRILLRLDAAGTLRALDLVRDGRGLAMIVADFGGENLPPCTAESAGLDVFFTIAIAVTKTLGLVHAQGVVHKDVKPRNILMNPATGEVKLIDFNSATELARQEQDVNLPSRLEGSLPYMSPEQTGRVNRELDYRTDYYSLGVTFFELLAGKLPFSASDTMGWVHCHLSRPVPDLRSVNPAVPEPLAQIVRKLMAKNPDDRYQSARGLLKDLERCRSEWTEDGAIERFALGAHDVPELFHVSQKLFGREREIAMLLDSFEATRRGPAKLVLVGGYSGVGKSSLIQEIQRAIVRARGNFVAGKFEQLDRNVPYGALLQALRGLLRHFLAEPQDRLDRWRQQLTPALEQHGKVLVDLLPELEQVIGPRPAVPDVSAHEGRARLQRVFREFIKAVARPEHPLVVFLDDLQWTDASTPELLVNLLRDEGMRNVLVIGAYRDNEVKEGHLLLPALKDLEAERPGAIARIHLEPLSEESVGNLVADSLRCEPGQSGPLSTLVFQKTAGNPFFVNELLHMLHRHGAFRFRVDEARWDWDYEKIQKAAVSDNVADLMVARLRRLPQETLEVLRVAACLGSHFDLATLARVLGRSASGIAAALREAVEQNVLLPMGSSYRLVHGAVDHDDAALAEFGVEYRFQHDRIQQAAYQLVDESERVEVHLRIGRLLLASYEGSLLEERIFEVANHFNLGRSLIATHAERAQVARLNGIAGHRAKRAGAYAVATTYLETALGLQSKGEWQSLAETHFDIALARIECIFLTRGVEHAAALVEEVLELAPSHASRVRAVDLKVTLLDHQGRMADAIDTIRKNLAVLGVDLPEDHAEIDRRIGEGIAKMKAHLARVRVEDLVRLPELEDGRIQAAMKLLFHVIPSAIQTYPPLFILAELMMFDLALEHGITAVSCKNFVDCGIILGGILGDYETAYRLGRAAFAVADRYAPTPLESGVHFVFGTFISHWRAPFREGFEAFGEAVRRGHALGDLRHPTYARVVVLQRMLLVGRGLEECRTEGDSAIAALRELNATNTLSGASAAHRVVTRLSGKSGAAHPSDSFVAALLELGNAQWLFSYGQAETMASVILGELETAEAWQAFTAPFLGAGTALFSEPDYYLFQSLLLVKRWWGESATAREATFAVLLANQEKLRVWGENSPTNYLHKYELCSAEIARIRGASTDEILGLYDDAIGHTGDAFIHLRALANERLAEYWLEKRHAKIARTFLDEAYYLYERWGAVAKLRELERRFPDWLGSGAVPGATTRTTTHTASRSTDRASSLDIDSITKATQAISGEVKADKLFARLMATLIESAGAQRGCLILKAQASGALTVEARAEVGEEPIGAGSAIPVDECTELCPEIVRYVARTGEAVVLDDAAHHASYRDDSYVTQNAVKSVLCMPVMSQGRLMAILYAENNETTHAFTSQRLAILQVIAGQAAISITNAHLYDKLEVKVAERTRELAEKNREIAAMLNSMQQGVFTIGEDLTIQPQYSAHLKELLGRDDVAGSDCLEMVFEGSSVGGDALDAMRCALQFTFGMPSFIAEVNASHLVQEFQRTTARGELRHFEVDWDRILDENGKVHKVLVALRDVTLLKRLKETVAVRGSELEVVGQILDAGIDAFLSFCASTRAFLDEIRAALQGSTVTREAIELIFRNMHTIKGNARLLGLSNLVGTVHVAEEPYVELRNNADQPPDTRKLAAGVDAVLRAVERYEEVYRCKLGELAHGSRTRAERAVGSIHTILGDAASGTVPPGQALRAVALAVRAAEAVPLGEVVHESARMLPSLAQEQGKGTPLVDCDDGGLLLMPAWGQVMRNALIHAFRNALDHGLESPAEREMQGKPAQGRIRVHLHRTAGGTVIRVADDGRGLRLAALRESSGAVAATDEDVANTIFVSGVSTATKLSSTSGRGVGMDAIRSFVRRQGGDVHLAFTAEGRDGFRPFELVFHLPEGAVVDKANESDPPALLAAAS